MNKPLDLRFGKYEFLHWVEAQEGRFELKGGRVVMMTGGSKNHARVTSALVIALGSRLDRKLWAVTASDLAVEIGEDIRYPDVLVEPRDDKGAEHSTREPVLLVEVLSPSSLAVDLHDKPAEYLGLSSLECYIVAAQDEPRVWVWQRAADGARPFPDSAEKHEGIDATIPIRALGIDLPLAEIY